MATRLLLVEDNTVYRSSLELLLGLQPDLEVVGAVGSGDEAAEAASRLGADVVLMDYRLPGIDGAAATRAVIASSGAVVVCLVWLLFAWLVTPEDRPAWITEARSLPLVKAGAELLAGLLPSTAVERGAAAVDEAGRQLEEEARQRALEMSPLGGADPAPESPPAPDSQTGDPAANPAAPAEGSGYKDRERQDMNLLFEQAQ